MPAWRGRKNRTECKTSLSSCAFNSKDHIPASMETFPRKKYFPCPLERATPTLRAQAGGRKQAVSLCRTQTHTPSWRTRRRSVAPPERRPFDVGEVIVIVHLQHPSLKANRTQKQVEVGRWSAPLTCEGDAEHVYPSVYRLLHLHGESPRSPVHHGVAELEEGQRG